MRTKQYSLFVFLLMIPILAACARKTGTAVAFQDGTAFDEFLDPGGSFGDSTLSNSGNSQIDLSNVDLTEVTEGSGGTGPYVNMIAKWSGHPTPLAPESANAVLVWVADGVSFCFFRQDPLQRQMPKSGFTFVTVTKSTMFELVCPVDGGDALIATADVIVGEKKKKPKNDFFRLSKPGPINFGGSVTISWRMGRVSQCKVSKGIGIQKGKLIGSGTSGRIESGPLHRSTWFRIGCDNGKKIRKITLNVKAPTRATMFASSIRVQGNGFNPNAWPWLRRALRLFKGVKRLDALCNRLAKKHKPRNFQRPWKAFVSTRAISAHKRVSIPAGGVFNTDGTKIANRSLRNGELLNAVDFDEIGNDIGDSYDVWTGSTNKADKSSNPKHNCNSFQSKNEDQTGAVGSSERSGGGWLRMGGDAGLQRCDKFKRVYCVSQ